MFENLVTFVKQNKAQIIKRGIIVATTIAGLVVAGVVVKNNMSDEGAETIVEPESETPFETE